MKIEHEIFVNKYGQGLIDEGQLLGLFVGFDTSSQKIFLNDILFLIFQSKPKKEDIELAIVNSHLKPTFTPCILLRKGVANHNLQKITNLPDYERTKVFILLMHLFKIAYKRRFIIEKNNPDKWWYWDLSDETIINKITQNI